MYPVVTDLSTENSCSAKDHVIGVQLCSRGRFILLTVPSTRFRCKTISFANGLDLVTPSVIQRWSPFQTADDGNIWASRYYRLQWQGRKMDLDFKPRIGHEVETVGLTTDI
jgi:hypothetical protein